MKTILHLRAAETIALLLCILNGAVATARAQVESPSISWTNNMLTISAPGLPGGEVEIWYLEAFCRPGSTHRDWHETTIPHRTELMSNDGSKVIRLRTHVEPSLQIDHRIEARDGEIEFTLVLKNHGNERTEAAWFQPCIRVQKFTGATQSDYIRKSFIFTKDGLVRLHEIPRAEEAIYRGGQVYVPDGIPRADVNPRPISEIVPANGLIGCFSSDEQYLLATAWNDTQELFQGVIICLHNDPRIGGLDPGETKHLRGKVYFMRNNPAKLLERYRRDFQDHAAQQHRATPADTAK